MGVKHGEQMIYGLNKNSVHLMIKYEYATDYYVVYNLSKKCRSLCVQFRSCILSLKWNCKVCQFERKNTHRFVQCAVLMQPCLLEMMLIYSSTNFFS